MNVFVLKNPIFFFKPFLRNKINPMPLKEIGIFWHIHINVCTELGCKYFFFKKIFWTQIRMNSLFKYNRNETAIFTKQKHVILT